MLYEPVGRTGDLRDLPRVHQGTSGEAGHLAGRHAMHQLLATRGTGSAPVRAPALVRLRAADRERVRRLARDMGETAGGVISAALDALEADGVRDAGPMERAIAAVRREGVALPSGWAIYVERNGGRFSVARVPRGVNSHLVPPRPDAWGYYPSAWEAEAAVRTGRLASELPQKEVEP